MYPYLYPNYYSQEAEATPGTEPTAPAVPGTTSGKPVTPTPPPPPTVQPPKVDFEQEPGPPVTTDIEYTQGYLRSQIGKRVRIEFLIGTNLLTDRTGTLVDVGISYVIIRLQETDDLMLGDIYSIKFVTFFR